MALRLSSLSRSVVVSASKNLRRDSWYRTCRSWSLEAIALKVIVSDGDRKTHRRTLGKLTWRW